MNIEIINKTTRAHVALQYVFKAEDAAKKVSLFSAREGFECDWREMSSDECAFIHNAALGMTQSIAASVGTLD